MNSTAKTIHQQLGGNKFDAMTGAYDYTYGVNFITFRISRAKQGINHVQVFLRADDTYTMVFSRYAMLQVNVKETVTGLYADQLQQVFTLHTGFYTSL